MYEQFNYGYPRPRRRRFPFYPFFPFFPFPFYRPRYSWYGRY